MGQYADLKWKLNIRPKLASLKCNETMQLNKRSRKMPVKCQGAKKQCTNWKDLTQNLFWHQTWTHKLSNSEVLKSSTGITNKVNTEVNLCCAGQKMRKSLPRCARLMSPVLYRWYQFIILWHAESAAKHACYWVLLSIAPKSFTHTKLAVQELST